MDKSGFLDTLSGSAGSWLIIYGFIIVAYVFWSLCLQFIARRTNTPRGWLAWIPFVNSWLQTDIAGLKWGWAIVLGLLLLISASTSGIFTWLSMWLSIYAIFSDIELWIGDDIDLMGMAWVNAIISLACAAVLIFVWIRIYKACNRPGWWGALLLIPVLNWVILGILAFTGKGTKPPQ